MLGILKITLKKENITLSKDIYLLYANQNHFVVD